MAGNATVVARKAFYVLQDWGLSIWQSVRDLDKQPASLRRPGARPVVMLPGVWENWYATWRWAEALYRAGFDIHFVPEMDRVFGAVPTLAERLEQHLIRQSISDPIVVAHSKGGLVAKQAMMRNPNLIRGLIACGTPFHGAPITTHMPRISRLPDLSPRDPDIRYLADYRDVNHRIVMIEAEWDQNVATLGLLPGSLHCTVPTIGHNRLLDDPVTIRRIVQFAKHIDSRWV